MSIELLHALKKFFAIYADRIAPYEISFAVQEAASDILREVNRMMGDTRQDEGEE